MKIKAKYGKFNKDPRHRPYNEAEEEYMNAYEDEEFEEDPYFKRLEKGKKEGKIRK